MSIAVQEGAAGVASIQPGFGLKDVLALHAVEIIHLGTDHTRRQRPQSTLLRMADGDDTITDAALRGLAEGDDRQGRRRRLHLEQGEIQWRGVRHHPRREHSGEIRSTVPRDARWLQKHGQSWVGLAGPLLDHDVGIGQDQSVGLDDRAGPAAAALAAVGMAHACSPGMDIRYRSGANR